MDNPPTFDQGPQPPMEPVPEQPVVMAPEPPKKNNTTLWIIIGVVAVLLCCCCVLIALGVSFGPELMNQFNIQTY